MNELNIDKTHWKKWFVFSRMEVDTNTLLSYFATTSIVVSLFSLFLQLLLSK